MGGSKKDASRQAWLERASDFIIGNLESFFYRWGKFVATYPWIVIVATLGLTGLSCIGFLNFSTESRAEKLWIPSDSPYITNKAWLETNFPRKTRLELMIFETQPGGNILTQDSLLQMLRLHQQIMSIRVRNNTSWQDVCLRIPIANLFLTRRKRNTDDVQDEVPSPLAALKKMGPLLSTLVPPLVINATIDDFNVQFTNATSRSLNVTQALLKSSTTTLAPSTTAKIADLWSDYDIADYDYDAAAYEEEFDEEFEKTFYETDDEEDQNQIANDLPPEIYCDLVNTLNEKCYESSILEIWRFDEERIKKMTDQDIVNAINRYVESPVYGFKFNYSSLLGSITRNASNHIVSASAAMTIMLVEVDESKGLFEEGGAGVELDLADPDTLAWEKELVKTVFRVNEELAVEQGPQDALTLFINAGRSFNDISSEAIFFDGVKMLAGYLLMFVYTALMLGKENLIELRVYLTGAGIFAVAMGLSIAYGLSSAFGLPYTPIHAILPFLALGIGIDDMFVIVQCWYNLPADDPNANPLKNDDQDHAAGVRSRLVERLGTALKHAGVAITVTSVTDVFAFGIGAVTILPGLQAFCVSCAIGIGSIYLLQASWFVAWLSLDQRRISAQRDGCFPCIQRKDWTPSKFSRLEAGKAVLKRAARLIELTLVKVVVLMVTAICLGFGIWGTISIRQEFDPVLLLPSNSYLRQYINKQVEHFPLNGWGAEVFLGQWEDVEQNLKELDMLTVQLEDLVQERTILKSVDSWWTQFKIFLAEDKGVQDWKSLFLSSDADQEASFGTHLSDFLFSRSGSKYKNNFRFNGSLECNQPVPDITASQFSITYLKFHGPEEHIPGRKTVESLIQARNFSSAAFSFSKVYAAWETDEVIAFELWRNVALAMVCVFVITLLLLAKFKICCLVLLCVIFTLVDMVGFLHFWDTTIDTISCINIVLAIGLCVDYSVHIAHAFIVAEGARSERAIASLETMGPAILNGGITTFLALVLLGFSESHAFIVFFKVFLLTVTFGLFHGIVFLPVVLCIVGDSQVLVRDDASHVGSEITQSSNLSTTDEQNDMTKGGGPLSPRMVSRSTKVE